MDANAISDTKRAEAMTSASTRAMRLRGTSGSRPPSHMQDASRLRPARCSHGTKSGSPTQARAECCNPMKRGVSAEVPTTLAADDQETSDLPAGSRSLPCAMGSAPLVPTACSQLVRSERDQGASPDTRSWREGGARRAPTQAAASLRWRAGVPQSARRAFRSSSFSAAPARVLGSPNRRSGFPTRVRI
jgi:hypothetical protein